MQIKITSKSSLKQIKPNLAGMVLMWPPFKLVSDSPVHHSIWQLLLKIEISLIVFCCFIISKNELYLVGFVFLNLYFSFLYFVDYCLSF